MKFTLTKTPQYWWPVTVRLPDADAPGKVVEQTLKVLFVPQSRTDALADAEAFAQLTTPRERTEHEAAQLKKVIINWDDVVAPDGGAVAFSTDALEQALEFAWFRSAVYAAYIQSLAGEEARLGN